MMLFVMPGRNYEFMRNNLNYTYLYSTNLDIITYASESIGSYFIILNSFVPLDLIIEVELIKTSYAFCIEDDVELLEIDYGLKDIVKCSVQNFTIHEEMGEINY